MSQHDASERFKMAMQLFSQERYSEALVGVDSLLMEYPGDINLLAARARCLGGMGRTEEALLLCRELEILHNYPQAVEIANWVKGLEEKAQPSKSAKRGRGRPDARKVVAPVGSGVWTRMSAWAVSQSGTRLVFLVIVTLMTIGSLPMLASSTKGAELGARILAYAIMLFIVSYPAIHRVLPILLRSFYTTGIILGSLSAVASLQYPPNSPILVFVAFLVAVSFASSLITMFSLIVSSLVLAIVWTAVDMAQRSCFGMLLLLWFFPLVMYGMLLGLVLLPLNIIGLKVSAMITDMDDEDMSLSMTEFTENTKQIFSRQI